MEKGRYGEEWSNSANLLVKEIQAIEVGNGTLLSSGTSNHAMLFDIECIRSDLFKVSVINIGAGAPVNIAKNLIPVHYKLI